MDLGPEPRSSRRLGFAEAQGALEDLVGSQVGVEVSAQGEAAPFLTLIGSLDRVWEVGQPGRGALALGVEDAIFRIARSAFTPRRVRSTPTRRSPFAGA